MERLILCGGGHVSLETAYMAAHLDFELIVLDDRAEFANRDRFPMAAHVLAAPFLEARESLGSRPTDYFVILTRATPTTATVWSTSFGGSMPMWA